MVNFSLKLRFKFRFTLPWLSGCRHSKGKLVFNLVRIRIKCAYVIKKKMKINTSGKEAATI